MNQEGHLSTYDLKLTVRSPLFVGNGAVIKKTGYVLNPAASRVLVLDTDKLLHYIVEKGLADRYESFVLSGQTNISAFLTKECGLSREAVEQLGLYQVNVAGALDNYHSLKEIRQITRTKDHQVYIPGSSLKGALRTALLFGPVLKSNPRPNEHLFKDYKFNEGKYTNTLRYTRDFQKKAVGEVASVLQGIRISDSAPISNRRIVLASKVDADPNGDINSLNVVWECIAPGTEIHFQMTLDHAVLDRCRFHDGWGINVDTILQSICDFEAYYQKQYMPHFTKPAGYVDVDHPCILRLGGNTGYFAKSLAYPYWKEQALTEVSNYMMHSFPRHLHQYDIEDGISPHMVNYAQYNGELYPMGICEVSIT